MVLAPVLMALVGAAATPPTAAIAPTPASTPAMGEGTMPLADVKPGMKGEWRTAVQGTEVKSFPLEVLGVMENFSGPRRSIIICQALDSSQMQNGPVAGMSGSPVYVDGKLVGAYAYGFTYSKDQALIGVTPIADMMESLQAPASLPLPGRPGPPRLVPTAPRSQQTLSEDTPKTDAPASSVAAQTGWRVTQGADRLAGRDVTSLMRPLPTPLMVSGVSARTLAVFKDEFARRGLQVMQAPGGGAPGGGPPASSLTPGSPLAVVLLSGDFSICSVGTLTWRQGDRVLAFGHPMFDAGGTGSVDLPLATADVVTVVRSYEQSFKLSNVGPIVGTISQDRLAGVAGTIGPKPRMTAFRTHITAPDGSVHNYQGDLWPNRDLSAPIGAMGLLESLNTTEDTAKEQTFYVNATLDIEGFDPVKLSQVASGDGAADEIALGFMRQYDQLLNNPFETPKVRSLDFDIRFRDAWLMSALEGVRVDSGELRAGDKLRVTLTLSQYRDQPVSRDLEIPIPESAAGETLTLFIGDAAAAETLERGSARRDFTSLGDVVDYIRQGRSRGAVYVKLLRSAPGLRIEGASLPALPPSVEALYSSPKNATATSTTTQSVLWETTLPVPGEFTGRYTMPVKILP